MTVRILMTRDYRGRLTNEKLWRTDTVHNVTEEDAMAIEEADACKISIGVQEHSAFATADYTESELQAMTKTELKALADNIGITHIIEAFASGANGSVLKSDYIKQILKAQ